MIRQKAETKVKNNPKITESTHTNAPRGRKYFASPKGFFLFFNPIRKAEHAKIPSVITIRFCQIFMMEINKTEV